MVMFLANCERFLEAIPSHEPPGRPNLTFENFGDAHGSYLIPTIHDYVHYIYVYIYILLYNYIYNIFIYKMYYTDPILIYFLLNIQENQLFGEELCVSQL